MSAKDIAVSTLATEPCRTLLRGLERLPFGSRILNRIIQPRGVGSRTLQHVRGPRPSRVY
jgi:hypothetical protein